MLLAAKDEKLCGLWFFGQKYFDENIIKNAVSDDGTDIFKQTKDWLNRYFKRKKPSPFNLPLVPYGSDFRDRKSVV